MAAKIGCRCGLFSVEGRLPQGLAGGVGKLINSHGKFGQNLIFTLNFHFCAFSVVSLIAYRGFAGFWAGNGAAGCCALFIPWCLQQSIQ
jgi:hypothetical protein